MSETAYSLINDPRIGKMDASLDRLLKDVSEIKSDISTMKIDIALLKADSAVVRSNISEIKSDLRETRDRAIRNEENIKELKNNISVSIKTTFIIGSILAAIIAMAPKLQLFLGLIK